MSVPAVLVVTSHVVRGAVGGRASVFAMERSGFPVWSLPTAMLPWHPGQGRGTVTGVPGEGFDSLCSDIVASPHLSEIGGALTGYFRDAEEVATVAELLSSVRRVSPSLLWLCDPIFGDEDGCYRPDAVIMALRHLLLPVADIITPNRFELAWLTGTQPETNEDLVVAARSLGVPEVVVTSSFAPPGMIGTLLVTGGDAVLAVHERLDVPLSGTGDLFAALYLAHRLKNTHGEGALAAACSSVLSVMKLAVETGSDEMPLVIGQDYLVNPPAGMEVMRII